MSFQSVQKPVERLNFLRATVDAHSFWNNDLFSACQEGVLTREDFRFIFSQYYFYSRNFTRYLCGLMANVECDYWRARLCENLWEEGGGCEPEKRHAEIFRSFLKQSFDIVEPSRTVTEDCTNLFVQSYLRLSADPNPVMASAFLSLGTEYIVPRMYTILVEGMRRAGLSDEELEFFLLHIACDDGHSETIEGIMLSYAEEKPDWVYQCQEGAHIALELRTQFFNSLFEALQLKRMKTVVAGLRRTSIRPCTSHAGCNLSDGQRRYANEVPSSGIDFEVHNLPFTGHVLDPRLVTIAPGKSNEKHRHAHETVFFVVQGSARVQVNQTMFEVRTGMLAFVPRWQVHQATNLSDSEELQILAVTDFGLTGAILGNYDAKTRLK